MARAARIVYLVALGALLGWLIWTRRGDLALLVADTRPMLLVLALLLALGQVLPSVWFWTASLRTLGDPAPLAAVLSATARSVPARYIPGSVWYALGRAGLIRRGHGVAKRSLAAVAALEATLGVVVAVILGSALLAISGRAPGHGAWLLAWFILLAVAASPPAVNAALELVARRRGGQAAVLGWAAWGRLAGVTSVHWVWSAATFTVYIHAFPGLRLPGLIESAGAFLLAWAVGFLAVFAPQGAGVFEATVAALLVETEIATAAVVVAGYRVLLLVRDALLFAGGSAINRGRRGARTPPASQP